MNVSSILELNTQAVAHMSEQQQHHVGGGDHYIGAMRRLYQAMARTKRFMSGINGDEAATVRQEPPAAGEEEEEEGTRCRLCVAPAKPDFLQDVPETGDVLVGQPFLMQANTNSITAANNTAATIVAQQDLTILTSQEQRRVVGAVRIAEADVSLLAAVILFNMGLCHHLRSRQPRPPQRPPRPGQQQPQAQPQQQFAYQQDLQKALRFYHLAVQSLQGTPIHDFRHDHHNDNEEQDNQDEEVHRSNNNNSYVALLFVAITNNMCALLAEQHSADASSSSSSSLSTLAHMIQMAQDWCECTQQSYPFFYLNAEHWLGVRSRAAPAA